MVLKYKPKYERFSPKFERQGRRFEIAFGFGYLSRDSHPPQTTYLEHLINMRRLHNLFLRAILLTLAFSFANVAQSDTVHTPAAKSPERQAILDALRGGENVIYQVNFIKVHNGWAWVDTTPLDPQTKQATAEGGPNLLHLVSGKWTVMDLSKVPEDKNDPMGAEDASSTFVRNLRRMFKGCPADIFPKPSH